MDNPCPDPTDLQATLSLKSTPTFVAEGGFKAVYSFENCNGQIEALKVVGIPNASTPEAELKRDQLVARAKREIEALGGCNHPNIVKLGTLSPTDASFDGHDYLIYSEEFLPGTPLSRWLYPFSPPGFSDLYELADTLIDLIGNLTASNYIHRDIKPENVMETGQPSRRFVVLDMGIAYKTDGTELTAGGSGPPGTIRYMAPEMFKPDYKDKMDFRCDLYSAGLTVYVLATGKHPFAPDPLNAYHTVYRILNVRPEKLHDLRPDLPMDFCALIDRMIKKKPALRFPTPESALIELKKSTP